MIRTLCVTDELPWPTNSGYRIRIANVVRALATLGPVDLFAAVSDAPEHRGPVPPDVGVVRHSIEWVAPARRSLGGLARWATGSLPRNLTWRDWSAARARLRRDMPGPYDVAWFVHADVYVWLGASVGDVPAIVDLDNLEEEKLLGRMRARARDQGDRRHRSLGERASGTVAALLDRVDARRWHTLEQQVAGEAYAAVLCSDLDRDRLAAPRGRVAVVPNGYDGPPAVRHPERVAADRRTVTMVSLFTYEPNADGARFLVDQVLPAVRAARPDVEVRLVGRHDGALDRVGGDGVTVTGPVTSVQDELARADVIVVPIRFGGGTRVKVLEAFAWGIPVVSTSVGCEGLGTVDGGELLVADDAASFAAAIVRLLHDDALRDRLVERARRHYDERFSWDRIRPEITALVESAATFRGGR